MPSRVKELELDRVFWRLVSTDGVFEAWLLAKTKFQNRNLSLIREEKWHQRWYRDPETGKDSETDILLIFRDLSSGDRLALHIENKPDHGKWMENQAKNYRKRAINRMEKWRYVDFQTVIIAPQRFLDSNPGDVAEFDLAISYEQIRQMAPDFGQAAG